MRIFNIGVLFLAVHCSVSLYASDDLTKRLQETLDQIRIDQLKENQSLPDEKKDHVPGLTAAIVFKDGQEIILATGLNDVEKGIPMSPEARMLGGSTGKMFAGALAALLIFEGKIGLDQKIAPLCEGTSWIDKLPNRDSILFRHLLNHTSGLASYFENAQFLEVLEQKLNPISPDYTPYFHLTFGELMQFANLQAPLFPAGIQSSYSENGYLLVGYIIGRYFSNSRDEEIIQRAYHREVMRRILHKLNLSQTEPNIGPYFANLAQGYIGTHPLIPLPTFGKQKVVDEDGFLIYEAGQEFSGGGLVTSSRDLARFIIRAAEGGFFENANDRQAFKRLYLTAGPKNVHGEQFGLGPTIEEDPHLGRIISHQGLAPGYLSAAFYFEDVGIAIALQVNSSQNRKLRQYARTILGTLQKVEAPDGVNQPPRH
jgi:D-alanyl-D-alanine carboxypeptidase